MKYSIVIPTRRTAKQNLPLLQSISTQTFSPEKIFLILDKIHNKKSLQLFKKEIQKELPETIFTKIQFISNENSFFIPNKWVSYVRNYGFSLVNMPLLLSIDDDNIFNTNFCENFIKTRKTIKQKYKEEVILIPSEVYKWKTRSRGYKKFIHRLWIQKSIKIFDYKTKSNLKSKIYSIIYKIQERKIINISWNKIFPIQFASSNCFFWPSKLFQSIPFDERMKFVYEDFDVTKRYSRAGHKIYVMLNNFTNHNMRKKTPLQDTYLSNTEDAYQKSRNRILFVKNSWSFLEKFDFFCCGLRIHTIFLFYKIIRFAPSSDKKPLFKTVIKWIRDGLSS